MLETHGKHIAAAIRAALKYPYTKRVAKRGTVVRSWSWLQEMLANRGFKAKGSTNRRPKLIARSAVDTLLRDLTKRKL